ncbi:ribonuclease T2 [Mycoplana sp. BE70]|uniref:ribonuclease T2 family protein n=1 Tax=Mycoplana sp. BE70 TaxID=2817775 RepID=UPI002862DF8E|nr:ribonuclease [Mycoplana sp. BE70]MDR6756666.1 ribonuclease T2 [Mycoplana sp. BE70]
MQMTAMFLFLAVAAPAAAVTLQGKPEDDGGKSKTAHVLALTWQPGFCLTKPKAAECALPPKGAEEATRLSLHGLWRVKKSYCGIDADLKKLYRSSKWTDLPKLALSETTAIRLAAAMPGVASGLDRHQWMMNGTCHAATAEDYYARSLELLDTVNGSAVGVFFQTKAGKAVTIAELAAAFDAAFGAGTGERVQLRCRTVGDEKIVTGLTIGLNSGEGELAGLIRGASATKSRCAGGLLVRAGGD